MNFIAKWVVATAVGYSFTFLALFVIVNMTETSTLPRSPCRIISPAHCSHFR